MLRKPASLVEGQAFVGTTFEKNFGTTPEATGDWYEGRIREVKDKLRGTAQEGGKLLKGLFFDVRSESQELPEATADTGGNCTPPSNNSLCSNDVSYFISSVVMMSSGFPCWA